MNKEYDIPSQADEYKLKMRRPLQSESYWSQDRAELYSWFQRNAPSLGELYLGSVVMLYGYSLPGRIRFVSHAVREIRNRLPDVISGVKNAPVVQYVNELDEISKEFEKSGFSLDGSFPSAVTVSETPSTNDILITRRLFKRISVLIKHHVDAREKPFDAAKRLFLGTDPENVHLGDTLRPVLKQWLKVTDWFMKKTHEPRVIDREVDFKMFQNQFELFEATLSALIKGFFSTVEELDEILEETNT